MGVWVWISGDTNTGLINGEMSFTICCMATTVVL